MKQKTKVIVRYLPSGTDLEFEGDSIVSLQNGVEVYSKEKRIGFAGVVRGKLPSYAFIVKPKKTKWRLKLVKEEV